MIVWNSVFLGLFTWLLATLNFVLFFKLGVWVSFGAGLFCFAMGVLIFGNHTYIKRSH